MLSVPSKPREGCCVSGQNLHQVCETSWYMAVKVKRTSGASRDWTYDRRIMRAGDNPPNQHKPTAMDTMIEINLSKIYWFLMDRAGGICEPLHRQCTAESICRTRNTNASIWVFVSPFTEGFRSFARLAESHHAKCCVWKNHSSYDNANSQRNKPFLLAHDSLDFRSI